MHFPANRHGRWAAGLIACLCAVLLAALAGAASSSSAAPNAVPAAAAEAALPTMQSTAAYTVNVPLLAAAAGDAAYDANNWAVVWFGEVSSDDNNYGDLRLLGDVDGVTVRAQLYDLHATPGDVLALDLNGHSWRVPYSGPAGEVESWEIGERCADGGCRGWSTDALIPWSELGGKPQEGDIWPLRVTFTDSDADSTNGQTDAGEGTTQSAWPPSGTGSLRWGLPDYAGRNAAEARVLEVALSGDSMLGGGTDCASQDWPDYFPTWGNRNFGTSDHVNVQMQWDVADWPCYAKYYAAWSLGELPAGAAVISATVEMRQFGNPGFGPGYAEDGTKDTVMQVFAVDKPWQETGITWDNAPVPQENTGRTLVRPLPGDCKPTPYWYCSPGVAYTFDVTEIVRRAQAEGRSWASLALYTAAGQYHSGKFFYSREGVEPPSVRMAYIPAGAARAATVATAPADLAARMLAAAQPAATTVLEAILNPLLTAKVGRTYYISPNGSDGNNGTSTGSAWKTFEQAWDVLQPGDTLLLLDGTYTESTTGLVQPNIRNGEPGKPITIKALNDGKAVIDGEGEYIPVRLGENWGPQGAIGDWFVVEGLVARNGTLSSIRIEHGNHNVLRRVSAYNASVDDNSFAIGIIWSNDNLLEDCVAAGTGRYMINVFTSQNNTLRRCFTQWQQWDGREFCGVTWPNGDSVGVYNSSNTTVENVIAYGRALTGIFIQANDDTAVANNNQVLGSMALLQGRDYDGSRWQFGAGVDQPTSRPGPTVNEYGPPCPDSITQWEWGALRQGFSLWGQGELHDNVFRDILATGNLGAGWGSGHPGGPGPVGTIIDHATIYGNGGDLAGWEAEQGGDIYIDRRDDVLSKGGLTITNSRIANSEWAKQGQGARFDYRYIDRRLTNRPLLPWPMERRVQQELGISVGEIIEEYRDAAAE